MVVIAKYMGRSPLSRTGAATAYGKAFNFSVVGYQLGRLRCLPLSDLFSAYINSYESRFPMVP